MSKLCTTMYELTFRSIDRLVSATSPSDALESLSTLTSTICDCYKENYIGDEKILISISESMDFFKVLCEILSEGRVGDILVEEGVSRAAEFLETFVTVLNDETIFQPLLKPLTNSITFRKRNKTILKSTLFQPEEGYLVQSLLDLLSSSDSSSSIYPRVISAKILRIISYNLPTELQTQIMSAPNGVRCVIELLDDGTDEGLRNECLLLLTSLARMSRASARLLIFSECYERALSIASCEFRFQIESTKLNIKNIDEQNDVVMTTVYDCLQLCIEMTRKDQMGPVVFLGSRGLVSILCEFLDIRFGIMFRYLPTNSNETKYKEEEKINSYFFDSKLSKEEIFPRVQKLQKYESTIIPYLTKEEALVVNTTIDLFISLICKNDDVESHKLESETLQSRQASLLVQDRLWRLLVDIALYILPPPDSPPSYYVSGVPPLDIQLKALDALREFALGSGENLKNIILSGAGLYLPKVDVMERLIHFICTGGCNFLSSSIYESMEGLKVTVGWKKVSAHAIAVLRVSLSSEAASTEILHALAPPPSTVAEDIGGRKVSVVHKLSNILSENLRALSSLVEFPSIMAEKQRLNAIASAGALGIFISNGGEAAGEMMLRLNVRNSEDNTNISLIECTVSFLEFVSITTTSIVGSTVMEVDVVIAVLKFLCDWVKSTPIAVKYILSCHENTYLSTMLCGISNDDCNQRLLRSMTGLLVGLCMDNFLCAEEKIMVGWSRSELADLIRAVVGIGGYIRLLALGENAYSSTLSADKRPLWGYCPFESYIFLSWYRECSSVTRKRVLKELCLSATSDIIVSDEIEREKMLPCLTSLAEHQCMEIQELRKRLEISEKKLILRDMELRKWKRRTKLNSSQYNDTLKDSVEEDDGILNNLIPIKGKMEEHVSQHGRVLVERNKEWHEKCHLASKIWEVSFEEHSDKVTTQEKINTSCGSYSRLQTSCRLLVSSTPGRETMLSMDRGNKIYKINTFSLISKILFSMSRSLIYMPRYCSCTGDFVLSLFIVHIKNSTKTLTWTQGEIKKKITLLKQKVQIETNKRTETFSSEGKYAKERLERINLLKTQLSHCSCISNDLMIKMINLKELIMIENQQLNDEITRTKEKLHYSHYAIFRLEKMIEKLTKKLSAITEISCSEHELMRSDISNLNRLIDMLNLEKIELNELLMRSQNSAEKLKEENETLCLERDNQFFSFENMRKCLTLTHLQVRRLQNCIKDLQSEKKTNEARLKALEEEKKNSKKDALATRCEVKMLKTERQEFNDIQIKVEAVTKELHSYIRSLELHIEKIVKQKITLTYDNKIMENRNIELTGRLEEFHRLDSSLLDKSHEVANLKRELEVKRKVVDELQVERENIFKQCQAREDGLNFSILKWKGKLQNQNKEASRVISQWEAHCQILEEQLSKFRSNFIELENKSASKNMEITVLTELLKKERFLKSIVKSQRDEAEIMQSKRIDDLEISVNEYENVAVVMQTTIDKQNNVVSEAAEKVNTFTKELLKSRKQSEDVVKEWQENAQSLESTINELEKHIDIQRFEANEAISQWELRCNTLTDQFNEMVHSKTIEAEENIILLESQMKMNEYDLNQKTTELNEMKSLFNDIKREVGDSENMILIIQKLKSKLRVMQNNQNQLTKRIIELTYIMQLEKDTIIKSFLEETQSRYRLQEVFDSEKKSIEDLEIKMEEANRHFYIQNITFEPQTRALDYNTVIMNSIMFEKKINLGKHEDNLFQSNIALLWHVSHKIPIREIEVIIEILRSQIIKIRDKKIKGREFCLISDQGITRSKTEHSTLCLGTEKSSVMDETLIKKNLSASDLLLNRRDNKSIHDSFPRLLIELNSCREENRDLQEIVYSSCLQASMCRQELLAAKSDMHFLQKVMRDRQRSEFNSKLYLEDHIKVLEEECINKNKSYRKNLELLGKKLSHGQVERDKLVNALKCCKEVTSEVEDDSSRSKNSIDTLAYSYKHEITNILLKKAKLLYSPSNNNMISNRQTREVIEDQSYLVVAETCDRKE